MSSVKPKHPKTRFNERDRFNRGYRDAREGIAKPRGSVNGFMPPFRPIATDDYYSSGYREGQADAKAGLPHGTTKAAWERSQQKATP